MKKMLICLLTLAILIAMGGCSKKPMEVPELAEYAQNRTVTVSVDLRDGGTVTGSGFFIDDEGTIVTNYHVIDAADKIIVEVRDGGNYEVQKIVDFNEIYDIAVLKIDVTGNAYLPFVEEEVRTGESVYAVGSSLGVLTGTFSNGVISSTSRSVGLVECVQTTAAISAGNSGGPLVNVYGEVIGINAFTYTSGEGLHLAITIDTLNNHLSMDKNWDVHQFREWYKKEIDRSYLAWDYRNDCFEQTKINTYQHITGRKCMSSSDEWDFLSDPDYDGIVNGYDAEKGIFIYEYHVQEFDEYTNYLTSNGFTFSESKDFNNGKSYYYKNEFTGFCVDLFVTKGDERIVVEPYIPE